MSQTLVEPQVNEPSPLYRHRRVTAAALVLVVGLLITSVLTWSIRINYDHTESRLLHIQLEQASEVLLASIPSSVTPMEIAGAIATADNGSALAFDHYVRAFVGSRPGNFQDLSLWTTTAAGLTRVASDGANPALTWSSPRASSLARQSVLFKTFSVVRISDRLGMMYAVPGSHFVVYGEKELAPSGHTALKSNSAFSDLGFVIYLGTDPSPGNVVASDVAALPTGGPRSEVSVPFGTTSLTLVATPIASLQGGLAEQLPGIAAVIGVLLSILAALCVWRLTSSRRRAELDAQRSHEFSNALAELYAEQREIAETLQRSLLPVRNPEVSGIEVASRYVAGARGAEVGGDWYSMVEIDDTHYAFVVGDVCGRGVHAATVMAALRFTIRTLILEGHDPSDVLVRCGDQIRDHLRDHFATVLVGVGNKDRHELVMANAGHLTPLTFANGDFEYVQMRVGPPLGVGSGPYLPTTIPTPAGMTLVAFTDGLVERRGEHLDVGLERLAHVATRGPTELNELVTLVITELTDHQSEDDIAVLALRFQ